VAVLVLDEPIVYSDEEKHQVRPICLPKVKNWNKKSLMIEAFLIFSRIKIWAALLCPISLISKFKSPGNYIF
jgi:hypothetical protein